MLGYNVFRKIVLRPHGKPAIIPRLIFHPKRLKDSFINYATDFAGMKRKKTKYEVWRIGSLRHYHGRFPARLISTPAAAITSSTGSGDRM